MPRIKIDLPHRFIFVTTLPVRITDLNYGGHLGNDAVLSLIHEARMRFLQRFGYTEMNVAGVSLIMGDAAIEFKQEAFYGDELKIYVTANDFTRVSFDLYYKLTKSSPEKEVMIAAAKTGMVCYNYQNKKIVTVPETAKRALTS